MKELIKLHKKFYGGLDHFIELKTTKEKLPYGVAVMDPDPDYGDETSNVTSLGLSLLSPGKAPDIELTMRIKGKLSEEVMREIGHLFHTVYGLISADNGFVEGRIYKDLSIPLFEGMHAVMVRNRFYPGTTWLDEEKQKTNLVALLPLYAAEAEELEEIITEDRAWFVFKSKMPTEDTARKQDSIVRLAVYDTWTNISTWHTANQSRNAAYLANALGSTKQSRAGEELEKKLGFKLPADFRHSFNLIHERIFIGVFDLLPEADILRKMEALISMNAAGTFEDALYKIEEDTRMKRVWWHEKWVPIGFNSGGDQLILDMSPGPEGIPGQILIHYNDQGPWVKGYHNFLEWLSDYNTELVRKEHRVMEDGRVLPVDEL